MISKLVAICTKLKLGTILGALGAIATIYGLFKDSPIDPKRPTVNMTQQQEGVSNWIDTFLRPDSDNSLGVANKNANDSATAHPTANKNPTEQESDDITPVESVYSLKHGERKYIKHAHTNVSVSFGEEEGEGFASLTLIPDRAKMSRKQILGSHQTISFTGADNTNYILTVLSIDFNSRVIKIDIIKTDPIN